MAKSSKGPDHRTDGFRPILHSKTERSYVWQNWEGFSQIVGQRSRAMNGISWPSRVEKVSEMLRGRQRESKSRDVESIDMRSRSVESAMTLHDVSSDDDALLSTTRRVWKVGV